MKKLILLISLFSVISFGLSAQYYCISYQYAGQNPKGLNTENDADCLIDTDWTFLLQDTSGTPVWSGVAAIPFAFSFNSSPVDSFKVSTSAVLTFTTNAVAVPPVSNTRLPSSLIPDNSVCVCGIASLGGDASIWTKTFGTAPNRQFWIEFADFDYPSTESYNFWSIVLEETTNNIYIVDQATYVASSGTPYMSLGVQVNSTTACSVPGSPFAVSLTEGSVSPGDNSYYRFFHSATPDIEFTSLNIPAFELAPDNIYISGTITNVGNAPIDSFRVTYQNGTNASVSYLISGVNIPISQTYSFTDANAFNVANPTIYPLKVWLDLNGDVDHINDTLSGVVNGLSFVPSKNVLFEESTGTWCGFCPGGAVMMDSLNNNCSNAILIAVHDEDPMTDVANDTLYDDTLSSLIQGFPSITIDRSLIEGNVFSVLSDYSQFITDTVPVEVSVTSSFNQVTRVLTINASGHFATDLNGDYRLNAVVTEDTVHGISPEWSQSDYFSSNCPAATNGDPDCTGATQELNGGTLIGDGYNWVTEPDPVPAAVMYYNWVARAILGGFRGLVGSLPTSISNGNTYSYTFTYTVPSGYNINHIKVIAWVINASTGVIYNSAKATPVLGIKENSLADHLFIYPNPSTGLINVKSTVNGAMVVKLNVMNSIGETVKTVDKLNIYGAAQLIDLSSFSNGLYFLQFTDENNNSYVSKIMINR